MPHMMPMLWVSMMLFTLMILFIISSLIYFMYMPSFNNFNLNSNSLHNNKWNWKW